jgi:prolipoprotein diacylglyceryltransferase
VLTVTQAAIVHNLFEWGALFVGARIYLRNAKTSLKGLGDTRQFGVVLGCVVGAAIGNKAVHWIYHAERWPELVNHAWLILQGQSIVGGLLGGLVGVEIAKKIVGVTQSTGDRFVVPILIGLVVGRVGCFLAGLQDDTYGNATTMPWGVDFGDGIRRHPTQLYDIAYAIVAWMLLSRAKPYLDRESGLQFKLLFASYLVWRLLVDGLKPIPFEFVGGMSGIQLVCLLALFIYLPLVVRQWQSLKRNQP